MSDNQRARAALATSLSTTANVAELTAEIVNTIAGTEDVANHIDGEQLTGDVIKNAVFSRMFNNLKAKGVL